MARERRALRSLTAPQRVQRRQDLLLAADLLRRQVDSDLTQLQPAADRVLIWVDAGLWLRRRWQAASRDGGAGGALAALGTVIGVGGIGAFALRHRRWLRGAVLAWQLWRQFRARPQVART